MAVAFTTLRRVRVGARGSNYPFLNPQGTGLKRSSITSLARYYSSAQCRFVSIDPQNLSVKSKRNLVAVDLVLNMAWKKVERIIGQIISNPEKADDGRLANRLLDEFHSGAPLEYLPPLLLSSDPRSQTLGLGSHRSWVRKESLYWMSL